MASEGTSEDQKKEIARVAETLFGTSVDASQVIGETLGRSNTGVVRRRDNREAESSASVARGSAGGLRGVQQTPALEVGFESTFGVRTEGETGRLIRQQPRRLRGEDDAAEALADLTACDRARAYRLLRAFLLRGSELRRSSSSRFPIFAFRLHQFLTRGDTVWTTIEREDVRHLELAKMVSKPNEPDKPLFPLVFCRQCGTGVLPRVRRDRRRPSAAP